MLQLILEWLWAHF